MNLPDSLPIYPDATTAPSTLEPGGAWDSDAIYQLIRSRSDRRGTPAFLMLGKREAELLKEHLAQAFGEAAVTTLKGTHYMGLEVVELNCERFLATAGRKIVRTLQDPISRRPAWRDRQTDTLWQLRV